jgi:hypothetical protein
MKNLTQLVVILKEVSQFVAVLQGNNRHLFNIALSFDAAY